MGLVFWVLLLLDPRRRWPRSSLAPLNVATLGERVVAVVPARDEAATLPETLPSLLRQDLDSFSVVLVDDRSSDETVKVAHELARDVAENRGAVNRLRVVEVEAPAPDRSDPEWSGKVQALAVGVATAEEDEANAPTWYIFTDADIRHRIDAVRALLATADRERRDLVSVMARLSTTTFWEKLLIPAFVFFFHLLYPFRLVARDDSAVAAAAGGCVLLRRESLAAAGGVAAIRGALIDDVALARAVKTAVGRLWLGLDAGIVSVREYPKLRDLWTMIARCAFTQLNSSYLLLAATVVGLALLFAASPITALVASLGLGFDDSVADRNSLARAAVASLASWGAQSWALFPYVRHHRVSPQYSLALPLASVFYGLMTVSSAWSHLRGRGAEWKGRRY